MRSDRQDGKVSCDSRSRAEDTGCFANSANNVTADITVNEGKLTVTRCIAACGELGYSWAGVQNREREF